MLVFNLLLFKEINFCNVGKMMLLILVMMICDDNVYCEGVMSELRWISFLLKVFGGEKFLLLSIKISCLIIF